MHNVLYLLLISFGALFLVATFHFTIFLQHKDKAYLYYAAYLFVMCLFTALRILDGRLTPIYPLSDYTIETWDPILSNIGFIMYVNFLGVVLRIGPSEKFYYKSWRAIRNFVLTALVVYASLRVSHQYEATASFIISAASFAVIGSGIVLALRLFRHRNETFFRLIISGTLVAVVGVFAGLLVNNLVYHDKLAYGGLYFLESAMMIESIFVSAALGYRLKLAYIEKEQVQGKLLEETQLKEALAVQTASLLRKELDIQNMQSRISKDLHDDVGASLSSIRIYSDVAQRLLHDQPHKAHEVLAQISDNARNVIDNMSDIVWAMKTMEKDGTSLSDKIINFGSELLNAANIECDYQIDESAGSVIQDIELRRNLYLVVKEALNNIAKHSRATQASVQLSRQNAGLLLVISDNGAGFDCATKLKGNGVGNIRQRIGMVGGNCEVQSVKGSGTTIRCFIPLPRSREEPQYLFG